MPVTPEDIANKKFSVSLRGYDAREVDAFLKEVAGLYRDTLSEAQTKASAPVSFDELGQEVGAILRTATDTADNIREKAQQEAAATQQDASDKAAALSASAEHDATAQREKAAQEGDRILNAARSEAERMDRDALRQKSQMLDAAVQRHDQLKKHEQELRTRIEAVEGVFKELRSEMEANQPADDPIEVSGNDVIDLTSGARARVPLQAAEVQPRPVPGSPSSSTSSGGADK